MKPNFRISVCTYTLLIMAGAVSFTLPDTLTVSPSYGSGAGDQYKLITIVRDFRAAHPDFDVLPTLGYGHDVGLVKHTLGTDERPDFNGSGILGAAAGGVVVTGSYVGNGTDDRAFTGLGFAPAFLVIKADDSEPVICRTSSMSGDASKEMADDVSLLANRIQSLGADGFTLGSDNDVNENSKTYHWTAFAAKPGEIAVGSFVGDGTDDRVVMGLGFDPDLVIVLPEGSRYPSHRSSVMPLNHSLRFRASGPNTNDIQALVADGFEVGDSNDVNEGAAAYHYVAWKAVGGEMAVGQYSGDGNDNRAIGGLGFRPAYVFIKNDDKDDDAVHRTAGLGTADQSLSFSDSSNVADGIQQLLPNGFEVGRRDEVNNDNDPHYWAAFRANGTVMDDEDGSDEVSGGGIRVATEWRDSAGRPMAPHLEGYGAIREFTNFEMVNQTVVPQQEYAVMVDCLGSQIYSSYHRPVTAKIRIGAQEFEPFGPYGQPVEGNVNDDQSATGNMNPGTNPRQHVFSGTFSAGDALSVVGKSWRKIDDSDSGLLNSHWETNQVADSQSPTIQIIMLRDGDDVPDNPPLNDQASLQAFIADFIDLDAGKMTMCDNQVIFLFELGTTGTSSSADFQDLVLLVTFAEASGQLPPASGCDLAVEDVCGTPIADVSGTYGSPGDGAITDAASFDEWFTNVDGVNDTVSHTITMVDGGTGIYEHLSSAFYPIDGMLFGDEGEAHNTLYTLSFAAKFTYDSCVGQFIQFEGADDAWMFIDQDLVIDLGGIRPTTNQFVFMDRKDLVHGERYTVRFFFASRTISPPEFRLRTNLELDQSDLYPAVGSMFD